MVYTSTPFKEVWCMRIKLPRLFHKHRNWIDDDSDFEPITAESFALISQDLFGLMIEVDRTRLVDYDSEHASDELVANFVDKIVMKTECDVDWYINLKGDAQQFRDAQSSNRKNEPYEIRRDRTNRVQKEYYIKAFTIYLGFDEAKAFKQKFGKFIDNVQ